MKWLSLLTVQRSQEVELWCRVNQVNTPLCSMDCLAMENSNTATRFLQIARVFSKNKQDQWDTQKYVLLEKVLDRKGHSRQ